MLSVGGYAAGPISAAAVASRVPLFVVEPNAIPGLTHRWVGRFAKRAFVTWEESSHYFRSDATRVIGTPVRRAFLERAERPAGERAAAPHLLITGGSQGARGINRVVPGAAAVALKSGVRFTVTHQTGVADLDAVKQDYAAHGLEADVVPYIDDVAAAMARADLIVCRAGAGTVAELGVIGRPAVFVPLPTAADDHQRKNAEAVAVRGAGVCIAQKDLAENTLADALTRLFRDRGALDQMARKARELGRPNAADEAADEILAAAR